ncbi:MAG TPA: tetratricopeptide repeat protein, partial [candidate division Zixibacteria bacterium]|nr:tetratricopeptide repeat protein [candidate division Zixibacteria bacterium]
PKGQVKIMDFGLAKLKGATKLTKAGSTLGTAAYMSPEQASGEEVDQRSDIFSFGVVLYEMLTSQFPFGGEHQSAIIYSILNEEPQPLARFNNKVSPEIERIISKALAKDKEERYQHVDDLLADLRRERKGLEYAKSSILTQTYEPPKPKKNILKVLIPASVVVVVALLFFILNPFKVEFTKEQTALASQNSLAVMYFENIPDPEDKDHTGEMLTNLLITSLSQSKGLEVISRERLYDIQKEIGQTEAKNITPALASRIALRAGVKTMLLGTILQKEPNLAVTSRLIEVKSGKILNSQRITGFSADKIFSLVDSLAILVRNDLEVTPTVVAEAKSVAEVTTNSPEAYRSFLEGVELFEKFYYAEAEAALKRAIELDSNFAMAYFLLSLRREDAEARRKALQKAWKLRNKVTERERMLIQAQYVQEIENNLVKASEILEKLLQKYPHEQRVYDNLAIFYLNLFQYEKALQTYLIGIKNDSLDKNLWNSLAYTYAALNLKKEALEAVDKYLTLAPGEPNPYDSKAEIYFAFGEIDSALYWYQKAISLRHDFQSLEKLGDNALLRQDYAGAEKYFQQLGSTSDKFQKAQSEIAFSLIPAHRGQLKQAHKQMLDNLSSHQTQKLQDLVGFDYYNLTLLAYEMGNYSAMLEYAKKCSIEGKKDPGDKIYKRDVLAWAYLKNGNSKMAYKIMDELKKDISGKLPRWQLIYDYCLGLLAYEEGKYELALEQFKKAFEPLVPNHAPQFFYALSLLKTGNITEAIPELQRVTWWSPISVNYITLPGWATAEYWPIASVKAHYWLGVAYEQQGEKDKAIKEYEKFLEIWKNAEPELRAKEMKDAKARLAKLKIKT